MRSLDFPCPKCHQLKLTIDEENSKIKCYNPLCDYESVSVKPLDEYERFQKMARPDKHFQKMAEEIHKLKIPEITRHQDMLQPDINLFPEVGRLRPDLFPGGFPQIPGFYRIAYEPDEGERKALFWGSYIVSSIIIIGFLAVASVFWEIPWQTLTFGFLFWALVISRGADILSTFFILGIGGIETHPLSDPHDITKLLRGHGFQVLLIFILAYFLGQWKPWLGTGLLLWYTIGGFRAALSNITQILHIIFPLTSLGELKVLFYVNMVICSFVICAIAYFVLPYFLP